VLQMRLASSCVRRMGQEAAYNIEFAAAIMDWHITPSAIVFAIRKELVHKICEREAPLLKDTGFSILAEHNILWH